MRFRFGFGVGLKKISRLKFRQKTHSEQQLSSLIKNKKNIELIVYNLYRALLK